MIALALVLGFPILSLLIFSGAYFVYHLRYGSRAGTMMGQHGYLLHAGALLIPLAVVLGVEGSLEIAGWWRMEPGWGPFAAILAVLAAAGSGALLFYNELWLSRLLGRGVGRSVGVVVEGGSSTFRASTPAFWGYMLISVFVVATEELLWRGYLLTNIPSEWGWTSAGALMLSAASFGLNHYYFGLRNILLKAVDGVAWGALFLIGNNLWLPFVSHLAFEIWVRRRLVGGV